MGLPVAGKGRGRGKVVKIEDRVKTAVAPHPCRMNMIEYNVLVKPVEIETKTAGGIIRVESTIEREKYAATEGEVIAISPLAFGYDRWPEGYRPPVVGEYVVFAKFTGMRIKGRDGVEYIIVKDKDIASFFY